jgi:hypothetical protein
MCEQWETGDLSSNGTGECPDCGETWSQCDCGTCYLGNEECCQTCLEDLEEEEEEIQHDLGYVFLSTKDINAFYARLQNYKESFPDSEVAVEESTQYYSDRPHHSVILMCSDVDLSRLKFLYAVTDCSCITMPGFFRNKYQAICDDEALLEPDPQPALYQPTEYMKITNEESGEPQLIFGDVLYCSTDDCGNCLPIGSIADTLFFAQCCLTALDKDYL